MGVPSFYRWLLNKYPKIVVDVSESTANRTDMEFDNLYLDMNGIIHPCFHPESNNVYIVHPTTFEDVFTNIYQYIDNLFDIIKPRKLLYMAIDGVAPRAKLNQQRARRFRTAKDNETAEKMEEMLRKEFERQGKNVLPKEQSELSDSNVITPGTQFMCSLSSKLRQYIKLRMTEDSRWKDIKVILSDANVPGEGEHKIMSFIRAQRSCKDYDRNTKHCLYGVDADLIMLALSTHEVHFSILREKTIGGLTLQSNQSEAASDSKERAFVKKIAFQFLNVWTLREYIEIDMRIINLPKNFKRVDLERIIDDFIFICFFAGNDFLPHMPTLAMHESALDLLIHVYKNEFKNLGGYLIDTQCIEDRKAGYIKLKRVEKFLLSVGQFEDKIFKKRTEMRERKMKKILMNAEYVDSQESIAAKVDGEINCINFTSSCSKTADDSDVLNNTRELKQKLKELISYNSDTFRNGNLGTDKVKLGTPGYKERYYDEKFSTKNQEEREIKRKELVQKYTEGLCWVLKYYYGGVPLWNWFYPFHYSPFASDLKGLSHVNITFEKGLPFKPFDQLMAVLPPRSADILPEAFKKLMLDENSNIRDFYPGDFESDLDGTRYLWQAVCKLPFIDEKRLLTETKIIEKQLKEHEKDRNATSADRLFVSKFSSIGDHIISIHKHSQPTVWNTIDITSNGICGFISIDFNDKSEEDLAAMCVFYDLPVHDCFHNHHLLEGVKIPEKTVTEEDIVESGLCHENGGNNFHNQIGNKSVSEGFKSFCQPNYRNLRQSNYNSNSVSVSTSSTVDWRLDKISGGGTESQRQNFGGWRTGNVNPPGGDPSFSSSSSGQQQQQQQQQRGYYGRRH